MPNWVSNHFTVSGLTEEESDEIVRALKSEKLLDMVFPEPNWETIRNDLGELPQVVKDKNGTHRKWKDGTQDQRWYEWRNENWGTKWDTGDESASSVKQDDGTWSVQANLQTAWSPPAQSWYRAFLRKYPLAEIVNVYVEEDSYHGVTVAKDGRVADEARGYEIEEQIRQDFWKQNPIEPSGSEEDDSDEYIVMWISERYDLLMDSLKDLPNKLLKQIGDRPNFTEFFKKRLEEKGIPLDD